MFNQYAKLILLTGLISGSLAYSYYGRLTGITNESPYKVTIQTSDRSGSINGQSVVQDREYDLINIRSMNLVVPQYGWDGDATIHVKVYDKDNKKVTFHAAITDTTSVTNINGHIKISRIQELYPGIMQKTDIKQINKEHDINFEIRVAPNGTIE